MKMCSDCKRYKSEEMFYRAANTSSGLTGVCKSCRYVKCVEWFKKLKSDPVKSAAYHSKRTASIKAWRLRNPIKFKAQKIVNGLRSRKKIKVPNECSKCHSVGNVQAHHNDYSQPLIIAWLCSKCHFKAHGKRVHILSLTLAIALAATLATASAQTTIYYTNTGLMREYHYSAGCLTPDSDTGWEYLTLTAPGRITEISLQPVESISSYGYQPEAGTLPFGMTGGLAGSPGEYFTLDPQAGLTTFTPSSSPYQDGVTIWLAIYTENSPEWLAFLDHRQANWEYDQTFTFGFQVESLTYTAVPEPSTIALLLVGGLLLLSKFIRRP